MCAYLWINTLKTMKKDNTLKDSNTKHKAVFGESKGTWKMVWLSGFV